MTSTATASASRTSPAAAPRRAPRGDDARLYALLAGLVALAWLISRTGLFEPGSDVSYWLAVCGGSMMLALLLYPARKYLRPLHRLGPLKWWFRMHLVFGIGGPWLIAVHSAFRVGSLNAGVALFSMVTVVASGIVGRFLYLHVHRGLHGEMTSLHELRSRAGMVEADARSRLAFAPAVEVRLRAFEQRELAADASLATHLRQVAWLPLQQRRTRRACAEELEPALLDLARRGGWTQEETARHRRLAHKLVRHYLEAVVRVAQYTAFERLFALWHVAHLPFVVLLAVSAIVHVVAVHAY